MQGKNWMTIKQVAGMMGVTTQTVRNYVSEGRIKAIILPSGHRRFYKKDIEEFINGLSVTDRKGEQC